MQTQKLKYKGKNIEFSKLGSGKTIVLLHGYLESLNVWDSFAEKLHKNFQIIAIDLPGHGNSSVFNITHSMELMAETVNEVVNFLEIDKFTLIGHSMGGYVAMEYVAKYPQKIEKFCLFHSTPFADSDEKIKERERIIELIKQGKKIQLAKNHVEKTFANENLSKYEQIIGFMKIIAINTPDEGVIATLNGMKTRQNHYETLKNTPIQCLWILGKKDNFININNLSKIKIPKNCKLKILENSGHQGYIEEEEKSIQIIKEFI